MFTHTINILETHTSQSMRQLIVAVIQDKGTSYIDIYMV